MIMINVASRIKKVISDPELDLQIDESLNALKKYFMHPEFKALLETVGPNGEFIDTINGRTINPGHCIETAWFLFDVAADRNGDRELTDMALTHSQLVMGMGMGQRIWRYHQLQRLQESSSPGLFTRHEVLVATDRSHHCNPLCIQTDQRSEISGDAQTNQ